MKKGVGVHIHGCHVASKLVDGDRQFNWDDLVIGPLDDLEGKGRATYGVLLAWRLEADLIVFSTGASHLDGIPEAQVTLKAVLALKEWFTHAINAGRAPGTDEISVVEFKNWLNARVILDCESQNTQQELDRDLKLAYEHGCRMIYQVTNGFHLPRASDNGRLARVRLGLNELDLFATCPDDGTPSAVQIEAPSRGDRPTTDFRPVARRFFDLPPGIHAEAMRELDATFDRLLVPR